MHKIYFFHKILYPPLVYLLYPPLGVMEHAQRGEHVPSHLTKNKINFTTYLRGERAAFVSVVVYIGI